MISWSFKADDAIEGSLLETSWRADARAFWVTGSSKRLSIEEALLLLLLEVGPELMSAKTFV
jgi:hypothetical protein